MARVPDLGSDFAQKLLLDLRRRRERLGFGSSAAAQQQQQRTTSSAAAAPRDARSGSQKPLRSQKPQQAAPAPRARAPEAKAAPTRSSYQQQPANATAEAGKPRRRRDVAPVAAADARAIVPYQGGGGAGGGGGKPKHVVASNVDVQRMAALALALSDGGKLRNIEIMARDGSVFLRAPDTPAHRRGGGAGGGGVAIGVQDLNDMLMAAYSSGRHSGRRRSDGAGEKKRLFRGSMDMEEALSMLVMLQDASGYVEGSGSGKVLLLEDKENREGSAATTRGSARIVEIVDEESETEETSKNASMQIVVHDKFVQSHDQSPNRNSSSVMQSGPTDSKTSSASQGEKDGSKVRMPSVIAKLMGLENLPSSAAAKTVVERKGTERFVKPESVPKMEIRANTMDRKLPIRIVASEKVLSKGQHKILLPEEWKSSSLTDFGEPELPNSPSRPAAGNKHVRLTMRDVLRKMVGAERGDDGSQGVDERIIHEDKAFTEEIKLQKPVSVGCRSSDSGKKMDFLKRFRKNSDNKPAIEEKHTTEGKSTSAGKKQATGMKRLLGRDSEAKSRREREKLNKENQATTETKVAASGKNSKADQMKRQAQSKHMNRQTTPRKARNCRETQRETPSRNLEDKKALTLKAAYVKKKPGYAVVIQPEDEEHAEVNDISSRKPSGSGNFPEELAIVVRGSSTAGGEASSYKTLQKTTEATSDLTISVQSVVRESEDSKFLDQTATSEIHLRDNNRTGAASSDQHLQEVTEEASDPTFLVQTGAQESESLQLLDQSPIAEINAQAAVHASEELKFMNQSATSEAYDGRINDTATETTRIPETFAEEEHQQQTQQHQQQQMTVKEQPTDGPDHTTTSADSTGSQEQATHVVSCDSFSENQLLLVRMLVKDRYLLETAKAIVRVHDPVSFVDDAGARSRPDKGNPNLLSDVAREVIRRKGKRTEAMEEVSVSRAANPKLRCLDDLVRELDGDVGSLDISKKLHRQSDSGAAEGLQMILRSDIQNDHPDANSTWDFGWNRVWGLPIEKNEVVRDLEKNILGGIITDVARDLIGVAVRHGCYACVA